MWNSSWKQLTQPFKWPIQIGEIKEVELSLNSIMSLTNIYFGLLIRNNISKLWTTLTKTIPIRLLRTKKIRRRRETSFANFLIVFSRQRQIWRNKISRIFHKWPNYGTYISMEMNEPIKSNSLLLVKKYQLQSNHLPNKKSKTSSSQPDTLLFSEYWPSGPKVLSRFSKTLKNRWKKDSIPSQL